MLKVDKWLPYFTFSIFMVKILAFTPSFADSFIVLALIGYIFISELRIKDKKFEEINTYLHESKEVAAKQQQEIKHLQTVMSSMQMINGMKPSALRNKINNG